LMMTDFMEEISRMRMEYATCVGKWCPYTKPLFWIF
jgi:hypothetical protein